jgi:hypothetical protein
LADNDTIDTSRPFIAIRRDREGRDFEATQGEYLVNPLNEELRNVLTSTGGFFSTDECVIESEKRPPGQWTIRPLGFVRIGLSTRDEYEEFVVHWSVEYELQSGKRVRAGFASSKGLADAEFFEEIPILGGPGLIVPGSS